MRSLTPIAAFALFLAVPLFAQHGGGGHAGGHGSGGFSGHSSFSGGHAGGGMHSGAIRSGPIASRGISHAPYRPGFSGSHFSGRNFRGRGQRGPIITNRGFRNCLGCRGVGYPWGYAGYYDPYWSWDSGYDNSSYDEGYERDRDRADQMNSESLDQQRMLRQEEADGDQDIYARFDRSQRPAPVEDKPGASIMPATVLIFRDQHKQEVQNYAIVGQTLWNFAPQHTQKIPLADLDLAATAQANDDRGVTFRIPNINEAQ
jgi:hypothetical protein